MNQSYDSRGSWHLKDENDLYPHAHSHIVNKSQEVETIQIPSVGEWNI